MKFPLSAAGRLALRDYARDGAFAVVTQGRKPSSRPGDGIEFTRGGRVVGLALVGAITPPSEMTDHLWEVRLVAIEDLEDELGRGFEPHIMGGYRPETAWRREVAEEAAPKRRARRRR